MIVLGFDTAMSSTSVGLRLRDGETLRAHDAPPSGAHPGHATRLLALADELLARAGLTWGALERIAVGVGPGTFTGLRVGVATARGLAQSRSLELVGVSSMRALAEAAAGRQAQGHEGVLAVIDARRGEAFAAAFDARSGGSVEELVPPRALSPAQLGAVAGQAEEQEGAPCERWMAVGDGAIRFRQHLETAGVVVPASSSPLHLVDGEAICELGARARAAASYEEVVPNYRRRPDAEIALERVGALESVEQ